MRSLFLTAAAAVLSLSAGAAHAEGYVQVHAGGFVQTEEAIAFASDDFLGNVLDVEVDADSDMGLAIGGLVGYYVVPFIALEGELTSRTSSLDSVTIGSVTTSIGEDVQTTAIMANAVFRPTFPLLPDPYVGIGLGYISSDLSDFDGDDVDGQFAYQMKVGVSFGFAGIPGTFGVEANYLATDDFDLSGDIGGDAIDAEFSYGGVTGLLNYKIGF